MFDIEANFDKKANRITLQILNQHPIIRDWVRTRNARGYTYEGLRINDCDELQFCRGDILYLRGRYPRTGTARQDVCTKSDFKQLSRALLQFTREMVKNSEFPNRTLHYTITDSSFRFIVS